MVQTTRVVQDITPSQLERAVKGFDVLEEIGEGGQARIFKARGRTKGRLIAFKVYDPTKPLHDATDPVQHYNNLPKALLRHPGMVHIYGADKHTGLNAAIVAMEFIDQPTLAELIRFEHDKRDQLSWPLLLHAFNRAYSTLDDLRQRGYVHRDIKADNIVQDGRLLDLDMLHEGDWEGDKLLSTARYLAPEEIPYQQIPRQTHKTDVYKLTFALYEALTGETPLSMRLQASASTDNEVAEIFLAYQDGLDLSLPQRVDLDKRGYWNNIFSRGLHPDPDRRWNAHQMRRVVMSAILAEMQAGSPIYGGTTQTAPQQPTDLIAA